MAYNKTIQEKYQHLLSVISSERFLKKQGLGNEVPFFICDYSPAESTDIEKMKKQLIRKLQTENIKVLEINLYDLSIDILKENDDFNWYVKEESSMSKNELKDEFQSILDVENILIPAMSKIMNSTNFDVMFLSGVGEVFPYIRSHNVLNNLQSTAKDKPTIMFFPGKYTYSIENGASLDLFEKLQDDKYYRAFNIYHYEV